LSSITLKKITHPDVHNVFPHLLGLLGRSYLGLWFGVCAPAKMGRPIVPSA
jgi:hypothetical protein